MNALPYSKKLAARIENPKNAGFFSREEGQQRNVRLVLGKEGEDRHTDMLFFYLLIDEEDGVIVDARFQAFGHSALIGAADAACDLMIRKNYDQAKRISTELIDKQVRDKGNEPAFTKETHPYLNIVLSAIEDAARQCSDIPYAEAYISSPIDPQMKEGEPYPGWMDLDVEHQIAVIEEVIASEIRPYIELDAGGIKILNLIESRELIIAYEGSCTSCHSATGATLNAVQQILQARVHPEIVVTPDISFLTQDNT
jgi:NifU-like protein